MSEHTREPWEVANNWRIIKSVGGGKIRKIVDCNGRNTNIEEDRANARRIVACVNACRGISTESLEAHTIHQMCAQLREEIKAEYCRPGSD